MTNILFLNNVNWKSIDGVLGTQTRGGKMEGIDECTELWRHPNTIFIWRCLLIARVIVFTFHHDDHDHDWNFNILVKFVCSRNGKKCFWKVKKKKVFDQGTDKWQSWRRRYLKFEIVFCLLLIHFKLLRKLKIMFLPNYERIGRNLF